MKELCPFECANKLWGYCQTTMCVNPKYSNIGSAQYGQGVQKRIITNSDRIRSMSDEELAEWISSQIIDRNIGVPAGSWLDWLRQEAFDA